MSVKIWNETVTIPTYAVGEKNKNPMFLEKRVYQGSSGKVYPWPVIDRIEDDKHDQPYNMIFLENEYLQVQVMPEIGGRIYRAIDKTNQYDFVYYNRVIKPALVGLTGPWISGGIEFNWPQHHRPNTFGPVEYRLDDSRPDRKTVWLSETDRIYGTKVTTGISLREGTALIEITCQLYNPTGEPQTFLWWANPAVAVHDQTQSIFPPDVHAVMDHGKRDVSRFPIATGTYYKMDYSRGVDISRYKNLPVPTSYMAYHSDYDFVGGYDYRAHAGVLHVADHHISPGKKQWTWGCGEFGRAWDQNLTDEDGPYIELMTGVFTDNQPDFTWLAPMSSKNFTQYFLPYKAIGEVKNANTDFVIGLSFADGSATARVYATRKLSGVRIVMKHVGRNLLEKTVALSPEAAWEESIHFYGNAWALTLSVSAEGAAPISYTPEKPKHVRVPSPAQAIDAPKELKNTEALLLAGLHLEQYRHATYEPEAYYLEGLQRDPGDIRLNNAYGNLLLREGLFAEAESCFLAARKTATRHSPNPYDGEAFFNLGKAYELQGKEDEAFDAYYKAIWSDAWRSQGYLRLAQISARKGRLEEALAFAKESLWANYKNFDARSAVIILNRFTGKTEGALAVIRETQGFDPMHLVSAYELLQIESTAENDKNLHFVLGEKSQNAMLLAATYCNLGQYAVAASILNAQIESGHDPYTMVFYMLADCYEKLGSPLAEKAWQAAAAADSDYCFPNTILDYCLLLRALRKNPDDAMAHYYLGCFLYDKKRYSDACSHWTSCTRLRPDFPTAYRNLALYYANKAHDYTAARSNMETAFSLDQSDARVFYELCDLYRAIGMRFEELYTVLQKHLSLVMQRDDLCVTYAETLNGIGKYEECIQLLTQRHFHPWEGGEGKVPSAHIEARLGIARRLLHEKAYTGCIAELEKATVYPPNFGEGKLAGAQENQIYYYMGLAYQAIDPEKAKACFARASTGLSEPVLAMYYNDQQPHTIFYQGLALQALGKTDEAYSRFNKLISYGESHLFDDRKFDYFAVSLPDFLVFERDLNRQNQLHCNYMMALGYFGLGEFEKAHACFDEALKIQPNFYGAWSHKQLLEEQIGEMS